jgi:hypothetical protein
MEKSTDRKGAFMDAGKGRTRTRISDGAYAEWEGAENKDGKDLAEFLLKHTEIENIEEMVESRDNLEWVAREHPEIIDGKKSSDEIVQGWEESIDDLFSNGEPPKSRNSQQ